MLENPYLRVGKYSVHVDARLLGERIYLQFPFNRAVKDEIKACLSNVKFHKELGNRWSCKDTPRSRFALDILCEGTRIDQYDKPLDPITPKRDCLYDHQREMLAHLLTRKRCVVAAEMGTGKTLAAIEGMEAVGFDDWYYVAPRSALAAVGLELMKWESSVVPRMYTYEKFRRLLENWPTGKKPPQGIVFDESSRLKNPSAKRTKAALYVADEMEHAWGDDCYVWLLTGSPAPKDPTDWWSQCEVARPGFLREATKAKMRDRVAVIERRERPDGGTYPHLVEWRLDEVELLARRLEGLVIVKLKKDCLDLPDKRYEEIVLEPSVEVKRMASMIARTSETAIQALTALRQLSDGFQYTRDDDDERQTLSMVTPKDDKLLEILGHHEEAARIVIYTGFHASIDKVSDLVAQAGWNFMRFDGRGLRTNIKEVDGLSDGLKYFQEGPDTPTAFIAHPKSGGMGVTLTRSPTIVYYSNGFDAEDRIQSEDRIHRAGMDVSRGATIIDLIHLPTDRLILENLKRKKDMQSLTLGEVVEVLK